ncbi:MAG: cupin domain-containing protein [Candidatus Limnocylindrales bacterium]
MSTYVQPSAATRIADTELASWPLPAEWVLDGTPEPRGAVISRSDDSRIIRGVWECTPGRFTWTFSYDETLVIESGRATVELDTGDRVELQPGVMAFFGRGHESTWTVHETLRKGFHADSPDPLPF